MSKDKNLQPKIVTFCCENSGYLAAEFAGEMKLNVPGNLEIIKLPCSGKLDVIYFMKALEKGADGVIILACQKENCKFLQGNVRAAQRVGQTQRLLKEIGIEPERVAIGYLAANMGHKFVELLWNMHDKLRELGPNPGKVIK